MKWQPIETAPRDSSLHVRGLWVYHSRNGERLYWDAVAGYVDQESGDFLQTCGDDCGWDRADFTHWMSLPPPPEDAND